MDKPQTDPARPKAFISYAWDDEDHKEWVKQLATRLRADGVDVTLDRWHAAPGDQIPKFMERAVRENHLVIAVCTPRFKERSDGREGGAGYEGDIMTAYAFTGGNERKFIPVLRRGSWKEAAPTWLLGRAKIDLSGDPYSETEYEELLRTLHGAREVAPPIGHRPNFEDIKKTLGRPAGMPEASLAGSLVPQSSAIPDRDDPSDAFAPAAMPLEQGFKRPTVKFSMSCSVALSLCITITSAVIYINYERNINPASVGPYIDFDALDEYERLIEYLKYDNIDVNINSSIHDYRLMIYEMFISSVSQEVFVELSPRLRIELRREASRILDEGRDATFAEREQLLSDWAMDLATLDFLLSLEHDRVYQEEILRSRPTKIEPSDQDNEP